MPDVVQINAATGEVTARDFTPTELAQREVDAAALAALAAIDANRAAIQENALAALRANREFLALSTPTNTQTLAQVRDLTRQNNAVIRLLLGALDDTD